MINDTCEYLPWNKCLVEVQKVRLYVSFLEKLRYFMKEGVARKEVNTRMHSSRMRTARTLTVLPCSLLSASQGVGVVVVTRSDWGGGGRGGDQV